MSVRNRLTTRLTALAAGTLVAGALLGSAPTTGSDAPAALTSAPSTPLPATSRARPTTPRTRGCGPSWSRRSPPRAVS